MLAETPIESCMTLINDAKVFPQGPPSYSNPLLLARQLFGGTFE